MKPSQLSTLLTYAIPARHPVLIVGPPGGGKCLGKGTPVLLHDGTVKPVEKIREGDALMGPDSKPRIVQRLSKGVAALCRVTPLKGDPYIVTANHILSLSLSPRRKGQKRQRIAITAAAYVGRSRTFREHAKGWRTGVSFPAKQVALDPYILGLWLGDGDQARAAFTNMEPEVIDALVSYAPTLGLTAKFYKHNKRSDLHHVALTGKHGGWQRGRSKNPVVQALASYGLSARKFIPADFAINSRAVRLAVLAGIIDTDGDLSSNCFTVVQKSQALANDIAYVARSVGLAAYISPCEKADQHGTVGTYYRVTISGHIDIIPTRVARKQAARRKQVKDVLVTGIRVEGIGGGEYFGFSVGGDGLFLLGDFTVTHNSDIVAQACEAAGADLMISHPAVEDPTDSKGLPWLSPGAEHAEFKPFGELARALRAERPLVWFLDDLGQAPPAVQAARMQLLLARRIGEHVLPDFVTFIAATNRRTDRAGVSGILEPVKSRFVTIVELMADLDEWCQWAFGTKGLVPTEMIAFLRFRPDLLSAFQPSADLTQSPSPRTWVHAAKLLALKLPAAVQQEAIAGAVGAGPAAELAAFLSIYKTLPTIDSILVDPDAAIIPDKPDERYALVTGLAQRSTKGNFDRIARYAQRLLDAQYGEFAALLARDAVRREPKVQHTQGFIQLASGDLGTLLAGGAS